MANENDKLSNQKVSKAPEDYSKYFDFSNAKVLKEEDGKTTYRIKGRDITINSAPNYKDEKRRGKEGIQVRYESAIPPEMEQFGKGKKYMITTYGCQMNEHDTEVMKGIFEQMGYTATEDRRESRCSFAQYLCCA